MTALHASARPRTYRNPLGRFRPKRFTAPARYRFIRDRRALYLSRISGPPSDWQAATIETLMTLEWSALAAEADGSLQALREVREHRRLFQRLLADFERSLAVAKPGAPSLAEVAGRIIAARGAGA